MSTQIARIDDDSTDENETDHDDARQTPRATDEAIANLAWALASTTDRDEWAVHTDPLSTLALKFDELREHVALVEWVDGDVYLYAHKPRGADPHPRHELDADVWLSFDPIEVDVRVRSV